jgi:hypothetical protein
LLSLTQTVNLTPGGKIIRASDVKHASSSRGRSRVQTIAEMWRMGARLFDDAGPGEASKTAPSKCVALPRRRVLMAEKLSENGNSGNQVAVRQFKNG